MEHLRGCELCEIYLGQLRATITALGTVPTPTLSDDTIDALLAAFSENQPGA